MKNTLTYLLLAFISVTQAVATSPDETKSAPIPFDEIGARATADYSGDAIGIRVKPEGVELRTGFQKLEALVTNEGMHLHSTEGAAGSLKLTAAALGRTGFPGVALPPVGHVSVVDQTVRFRRSGMVEEYSVSVDGLRQDFIMAESPAGSGDLRVELALSGATAETAAEGVKLRLDGSGRQLAYNRLRVTDAHGQVLAASLRVLTPTRLAIHVDDAGAVYPVRIDPTFSDADWVNTLSPSMPGANGNVNAAVVDGSGNLYIGGNFTVLGTVVANRIAKWNGSAWSALGEGVNNQVFALVVNGTDLYAGGHFTLAGGVTVNRVAKWDGSMWSALGAGISSGSVNALAVKGTEVYAGGQFSTAGGVTVLHIAKWDGSAWSALGSGMNGSVNALGVVGSDLYVGGNFTEAGGISANNIAKWSGSAWSTLGTGMSGAVEALVVSGTDVYAGGSFATAGGVTVNNIAKWNGSTWSTLGTGTSGVVEALVVSGTDVYVGGTFATAGGLTVNNIAKWNGSAWSAIGLGTSSSVRMLAVSGTELYAGGQFVKAGEVSVVGIAKWSGGSWSAIGTGMNDTVRAMTTTGTNLYVGGDFSTVGGVSANRIAKWDGSSWSALGTGMNNEVWTLVVNGTNLYAGGRFTTAGGVTANRIAKWNGSVWSSLGTGIDGSSWVFALATIGADVYAAGFFTTVSGVPNTRCIAKWNTQVGAWSALGTGLNNTVRAITTSGTNLYVGGDFSTTQGGAVNAFSRIAKWNGSAWSALGAGMNSSIYALAVNGTDLYAGGQFTTAGGVTANRVAKWNGSVWSALRSGINGDVNALAVNGTDLYAGGSFTTAGLVSANRIAKWDGSAWSALGTGVNDVVNCLAFDASGQLILGGDFAFAGTTTVAPYIVQANIVPVVSPEIALSGSGQNIANGDVTPDAGDGTAFGTLVVTGGTVVRTFTITNSGAAVLNLIATAPDYVTVSGSSAFSVTQQPTSASLAANGSTQTFQITFDPATIGPHTATVSISSNDADENPFTFALSGQGVTAQVAVDAVIATAGLSGPDAALEATPHNDGVENLLKYAFNMNLSGPDAATMPPGGTNGLPGIVTQPNGASSIFRFEFVRRIGSGLIYTPKKGESLTALSWTPLTDTPTVTPIDANWERVIYEEPVDLSVVLRCFGIVEISLP